MQYIHFFPLLLQGPLLRDAKAAGCKPDIYDDMLDYAHHWTTNGSAAKRVILAAFERVAEDVEAEEAAAAEAEADDDQDEGVETER